MSNLPEWVLKYKTKGIYVKKMKSGYGLYRGHSERVEGKPYPVFRCDEYLGIVTEKDGLIPSRPPVKPGIKVRRYGLYCIAETFCAGLRFNKSGSKEEILEFYCRSLLSYEGEETQLSYEGSWLREKFGELEIREALTNEETNLLNRIKLQFKAKLKDSLKEDEDEMIKLASTVYAVYVNGRWHVSEIGDRLAKLAEKYHVGFELKEE